MNDINDIRLSSISNIIGQQAVKEQVRVALDAAQQDGRKFDHAMLVGSPGLGKTQISQIIGAEMAMDYHELLGQSIKSVADLNAVLIAATDRAVVFVDEAHELDKSLQTALYLALDKRKVIIQGNRKGSTPMSVPISDFTLLMASTDEFQLLQPLRDRMRLVLRFEFYTPEELVTILRMRLRALGWELDEQDRMRLVLRFEFYTPEELVTILRMRLRALGWELDEQVLPLIAQRSRGTPRLALRLAQSAHRVARSEGDRSITLNHLERACLLEGTDSLGLGPTEQRYLRIVSAGPTRLNVIASRLGLPTRTVAEVVEPFLIRSGMVVKDDGGKRQLTAEGHVQVGNNPAFIV